VSQHINAPQRIKVVIMTMVLIRAFEDECILSFVPNELLFEIFQYL